MQSSNIGDWTTYSTDGYSNFTSSTSNLLEAACFSYREYLRELRRLDCLINLLLLVIYVQTLQLFLFLSYSNSYSDQRSIDPPKIRSPGILGILVGL